MKRFVEGILKWKTAACLMYTATMVIYLVFCLVFGNREVSTAMLWMLLLSCVCATLIQGICFSNWIKSCGTPCAVSFLSRCFCRCCH